MDTYNAISYRILFEEMQRRTNLFEYTTTWFDAYDLTMELYDLMNKAETEFIMGIY